MKNVRSQCAVLQPVAITPDSVDVVLTRLAADAVPRLRAMRGLISFSVLMNRQGSLVSYGIWETREAAMAARAELDSWFRNHAPGSIAEPVGALVGEVTDQVIGIGANEAWIWRWHGDPARVEQALAAVRNDFLPLIRTTRGFCRCDVVVDRANGALAAIVGFESEATADRARDLVASWSEQGTELLGDVPTNVASYSVPLRAVPAASTGRPGRIWPFPRRNT